MDGSDRLISGPDGSALRFYFEASKNNFQSEKAGRAIFDNVLYVEVLTPGSNESQPKFELERTYCLEYGTDAAGERIVQRSDKFEQLKPQIAAWKAQTGECALDGTPIEQWPAMDAGTAATLKATGIHTVEMLASVSDGNLQNLGIGGRSLRDQANAFINTRQFAVPNAQMTQETASLREQCVMLTGQVGDLTAQLNAALAENAALKQGTAPAPLADPLQMPNQQPVTDQLAPVAFAPGGTL